MLDDGLFVQMGNIIAVEAEVKGTHRDVHVFELLDIGREPPGQRHSPRPHSHQYQVVRGLVLLDDFMGDARQGAPDVIPGHDDFFGHKNNLLPGLARGQRYGVSLFSLPASPGWFKGFCP